MEKDLRIKISIDKKTGELKVLDGEFNKLSNSVNKTDTLMSKVQNRILGVASAYAVYRAAQKTISDGFSFNKSLEDSKAGLVALSVAVQDKSIPIMQRYATANLEAADTLEKLQKINIQTPHTLTETNQIYKAMYVSMHNAGASTSDMLEITRSLSIAAGAAGIEFNSLLAGVDGLATGTVLVNSDLGRFLNGLGLTNAALKNTDDVVKLVTETLKDFRPADIMDIAESNFENSWDTLTGKMTADSFDGAKVGLNELSSLLNSMSDEDIAHARDMMNGFAIGATTALYGMSVGVVKLTDTFETLGTVVAGAVYNVENLYMLSKEEEAALAKMYQTTRDNISARDAFLDKLDKSKDALIGTIDANAKVTQSQRDWNKAVAEFDAYDPDFDTKITKTKELTEAQKKQLDLNDKLAAKYSNIVGTNYDKWLGKTNATLIELSKSSDITAQQLQHVWDVMHQDFQNKALEQATKIQDEEAKKYTKVYEAMLNIQGSGYDKFIYKLGNEMGDLAENGATVQQQLEYHDYYMNKFVEDSSYNDWLDMVNQQLITMANNQASVNAMTQRYNELTAQRNDAIAQGATIDKVNSNPDKYANIDFSKVAAGSLGTTVDNAVEWNKKIDAERAKTTTVQDSNNTYNAPVYNAPIYNNTTQSSQSNYDPNNALGKAPIRPKTREATIEDAGLGVNLAMASLTGGMRQLSIFEENKLLALGKQALDDELRQTDEWKKYEENLRAYNKAVAARKEAEELQKYADAVASTVASLNTVLGNFEDGISSLTNSISTLTSFQDTISSYTAVDLQSMFYDSLSTVRTLETAILADPTNITAITDYEKAIANYTKYGTQYLQTQNFATSQDYEFAKAVANNSTASFIDTASTTDILLQQLADLTQTTNDALADGNITAVEAKAINAQATDILSTGTLSTADSSAYSWLSLIKTATADGTVTLDELKSINTATNSTIAGQSTSIDDTAINTGKIGRYQVSNTYGMVADPNNPNTSYFEVISQTYTPYAAGGFTGSGFGVADITGFKPAGIVHENEWVAPEWMIKNNPQLFSMLESARASRRPAAGFATGGMTTPRTIIPMTPSGINSNKVVEELKILNEKYDKQAKLIEAIAINFQTKVELDKRAVQQARMPA